MNTQLLIDAVMQQTVVFIAQLATAGGVRAPLAHVANEVFLGLSRELVSQGVSKKVIADMFGVALRTYHRRVRELGSSRTDAGQTLWEAVIGHVRQNEPVTAADLQRRFRHDDPEVLSGVLNDLVGSGLAYRAGRGEFAVYRLADEADFIGAGSSREEANIYLVWLTVYRQGPIQLAEIVRATRLSEGSCRRALDAVQKLGKLVVSEAGGVRQYRAESFEVPLGTTQGWEVAVLDHFQAMISAISRKLALGATRSGEADSVGGSTWSLDVWQGHPLEQEAVGTLARIRETVEQLRHRIDEHNHSVKLPTALRRVVFYMGQYVDLDERLADVKEAEDEIATQA